MRLYFMTSRKNMPSTCVAAATTRLGDSDCVLLKIRHPQFSEQHSSIGMRIGAHAAITFRSQFGQFRNSLPGSSNNSSGL